MNSREAENHSVSYHNLFELPKKLSDYINQESLKENAASYEEMQLRLDPEQERRVGIIRENLMQLPLIHATKEPLSLGQDVLPYKDRPLKTRGNTYKFDASLGLDQYVFLTWGLPIEYRYGNNYIGVSPEILTNPNTIVTPTDVGSIRMVDNTIFEDLSEEIQKKYHDNYFKKMVRGTDWIEIIARRALLELESGKRFFTLYEGSLGEIKHFGKIDSRFITRQFNHEELTEYYRALYANGYSIGGMEWAREIHKREGIRVSEQPFPEELGVDYEQDSKYWEELFRK